MTKTPDFTWSDGWLLCSVGLAAERGPATLQDVIAAGDSVNHAIFTNAELRRGFAKLIAAGHVKHEGDRFDVSEEVRVLIAAQNKRIRMDTLRARVDAFLGAAPYPAGHPGYEDPDWPFPQLTDSAINAAVRGYHKWFRQEYARLKKKQRK